MTFINRDFTRTENDDFLLNVNSRLTKTNEAVPLYYDGAIIGWKIQFRGE